mgnify:CR=1 FL=1
MLPEGITECARCGQVKRWYDRCDCEPAQCLLCGRFVKRTPYNRLQFTRDDGSVSLDWACPKHDPTPTPVRCGSAR